MIPIRDLNPTYSRPVVIYALIAVNVAVWLYEVWLQMTGGPAAMNAFVERFGVVPYALLEVGDPGSWVTPFSSMFMHGGWMHIIGNMWFLWVFGDNVEDEMGPVRFVIFYTLCGLAAVAAQVLIDPTSTVPMVGASGAIAGVLAGYVMLHPTARVVTLLPIFIIMFVELPAYVFIFVWFGLQLLNGFVSLGTIGQNVGGTAFFAHIGGFVAGLALVHLFRKRGGPRRRVTHRPRPRPGEWGVDRHRPWR